MARRFEIEGIITALLTPLTKDEQIKEEALRQLIDFQVEQGVHGLFPLATTGEGMKLSLEKRKRATEIIAEQINGKVPVISHVGTQDTDMTIELAKHAEDLDVDAICAVGPFFYKPDALGLIQHFKRVGEAVDLPLFIYNNVERQGYNIGLEDFEKIAKNVPQVAGLKDTSYSLEQLQKYVHKHGRNYTIVGGGDPMMFATFAVGASAHISAISNVFPELTVQLYEAMKKGDYERGIELQFWLNDIRYALKKGPYITPYKEALRLRGIDTGTVSSPLRSMDEEEIKTLKEDLKKLRVI